jgi:hypothetical protein
MLAPCLGRVQIGRASWGAWPAPRRAAGQADTRAGSADVRTVARLLAGWCLGDQLSVAPRFAGVGLVEKVLLGGLLAASALLTLGGSAFDASAAPPTTAAPPSRRRRVKRAADAGRSVCSGSVESR